MKFRASSLSTLLGILVLMSVPSCRSPSAEQPAAAAGGAVQHVVVCWLKDPGNAAHREQVMAASRSLAGIPGVLDVRTGSALPSTRPVVDSSYDVALVVTFADEPALHAYDAHPLHQQAIRDTIRPLVARFIVYDFVDHGVGAK